RKGSHCWEPLMTGPFAVSPSGPAGGSRHTSPNQGSWDQFLQRLSRVSSTSVRLLSTSMTTRCADCLPGTLPVCCVRNLFAAGRTARSRLRPPICIGARTYWYRPAEPFTSSCVCAPIATLLTKPREMGGLNESTGHPCSYG